ncbi:hypothetical protein H7J77_10360 [Mycolicibacillus parakoreensis]|uniref:Uncharacterized protein n=1 Tax=Mycolicibacillus parakoreensis TaxID=1069221 RepID=A0ABY3U1F8_9MYCO|nr:hypothetical protein [Mycolicibacillus parakoreensis]MCV7315943.1 hypothetical protein [Mycolicibacillus parakoreensis]ULN52425.1 hypothetical protein MIU77_16550 [Mycolicibacillus parakoreensis]HLR99237.1 hypothetical protein [Mycolicibacillus parakoreensis]
MTELFPSDSDGDIAEQAASVDDSDDVDNVPATDFVGTIEANPADVYEQQQVVPFDDEDRPEE